jgi:hypothetical protein
MPANNPASAEKKKAFRKYYLQKMLIGIVDIAATKKMLIGIVDIAATKKIIYVIVDKLELTKLQLKHIEALRMEYDYVLQFELPIIRDVPALPKPQKKSRKLPAKKQPKQLDLF